MLDIDRFRAIRGTLLAIMLSAALGGCGGASTERSDQPATPALAPVPTPAPTPAPSPDPIAEPAPDASSPFVPGNVTVSVLSATQVKIAWNASSDNVGVLGYRIYRDGQQVGVVTGLSYVVANLTPATSYRFSIAAHDAAGNVSPRSGEISATTFPLPSGNSVYYGNSSNYLSLLDGLKPGDTLILAPGDYDSVGSPPGLPIFGLHGEPGRPITIMGEEGKPRPVLLGRATHNTVRLDDASYVVVRHIEINGRDLGGDGVNGQGVTHDITLEDLYIHGVGADRQIVGISTKHTAWNWKIRRCIIKGAGTGMYLGDSDGSAPFVAGVIENNLIKDTIGYNIEIKHQNPRPSLTGMPTGSSSTIIRHNVFTKSSNSDTGSGARPNLLVGHFPLSGAGLNDVYEIYGNFFYQNPTEALFQGEGNIAFHHNLLVNDYGSAVAIQPHNDLPKMIRVFSNTVVAAGVGIQVKGGASGYTQKTIGNAVFAGTPIQASDQSANVTDTYARAGVYLKSPVAELSSLDLYPKVGMLSGLAPDTSSYSNFGDWDRDFNGALHDSRFRGAYAGEGQNPGWLPKLEIKPPANP